MVGGSEVGLSVGAGVGVREGFSVGSAVGLGVGLSVGSIVGENVGVGVGASVGAGVGEGVGTGVSVGIGVGKSVGAAVGAIVGTHEGVFVGSTLGAGLGSVLGLLVGAAVGTLVHGIVLHVTFSLKFIAQAAATPSDRAVTVRTRCFLPVPHLTGQAFHPPHTVAVQSEHGTALQSAVSVRAEQGTPPCEAGSIRNLLRKVLPTSQPAEQVAHAVHAVATQSTGHGCLLHSPDSAVVVHAKPPAEAGVKTERVRDLVPELQLIVQLDHEAQESICICLDDRVRAQIHPCDEKYNNFYCRGRCGDEMLMQLCVQSTCTAAKRTMQSTGQVLVEQFRRSVRSGQASPVLNCGITTERDLGCVDVPQDPSQFAQDVQSPTVLQNSHCQGNCQ